MAPESAIDREDLQAAIEARRELGSEFEPQVVESFVERVEKRLTQRAPEAPARQGRDGSFALALVSLGVAIPITAIAATHGGIVALIVVWIGIVLVNAVYNR
jgi:hypothetical protein